MRARVRWFAAVALTTALAVATGVALSEWAATGIGSGGAQATEGQDLSLTSGAVAAGGELFPGGTGDVVTQASNPNGWPIELRSIQQAGPITSDQAGCEEGTHGVTFTAQTGSWVVPAGGTLDIVLADALSMSADSADACQGATFTVPLRAEGGSNVGAEPTGTATATATSTGEALVSYGSDVGECVPGFKDAEGNIVTPAVGPTEEVLDGLDNDCDGTADEDFFPITVYVDADGDGFGDLANTGEVNSLFEYNFAIGQGSVEQGGDCDDASASIFPGAVEVPNDGIDQDCNGTDLLT